MATFETRLAQIRRVLEEATEGVWDDDTLMSFYNDALMDIAAQTKDDYWLKSYAFNSATSTQGYARPSYDYEPVMLVRAASYRMTRITPEELTGRALSATSADPYWYYVTGGTIYLYPTPTTAASYTYYSHRHPLTVVSTSSTVDCPAHMMRVVDAYTLARAYEQVGEWDSARAQQENYDRFLSDIFGQSVAQRAGDYPHSPKVVY